MRWMIASAAPRPSCQSPILTPGEEAKYVVQCNGLEVGMVRKQGGVPKQAPTDALTEADKPGVGPLAWPARQPHGPLRRAWFPVSSPIGHGLGLFQSNREANA